MMTDMKKSIKRITSIMLAILIIVCQLFLVIAATVDISTKTTRIASVPTGSTNCGAMEGLCVTASGSNNRLFVVKINENLDRVMLYMYKDYTTMSNSSNDSYGRFTLDGFAGHANGLAVDDNYIYITCWYRANGANKTKIARISRSKLWRMYKATSAIDKGTITSETAGCTILSSFYSDGRAYDKTINAITYYKNGKFIINYAANASERYYTSSNKVLYYTTAKVENGKFIVNTTPSEIFCVDTGFSHSVGQDIGYGASNGFFIAQWLGDTASGANMTKNKIIWIKLNSLSGNYRVYTAANSKYRHINVNKSANIFTKYELESVSIGSDKCLYANVNTAIVSGANPNYATDAVIRIERKEPVENSTKFLGSNISY